MCGKKNIKDHDSPKNQSPERQIPKKHYAQKQTPNNNKRNAPEFFV